jgi:hypothetical protein
MARWVIEREDSTVRKDGRVVRRAHDLEAAVRWVQQQFQPKDRVVLREEDGYDQNLSRYFERGSAPRLTL